VVVVLVIAVLVTFGTLAAVALLKLATWAVHQYQG
jgi:hypothetical protein